MFLHIMYVSVSVCMVPVWSFCFSVLKLFCVIFLSFVCVLVCLLISQLVSNLVCLRRRRTVRNEGGNGMEWDKE